MWTAEELEAMRRADAEIEADFCLTNDDLVLAQELDKQAKTLAMDNQQRKIAAQRKAWYEANREKVAAQKKAWYEANREKWNAHMREYRKRKRAQRDANPD